MLETRMNKRSERAGVPSGTVHLTRIIPGVLIISLWGLVNQEVAGRDYLGRQPHQSKRTSRRSSGSASANASPFSRQGVPLRSMATSRSRN
jgi:hypothetical protein